MPNRAEAGRPMDAESEIAVADELRLGGVDAHPHAHLHVVRPIMGAVGVLRGDRCRNCILRSSKSRKERLALSVHLPTPMLIERRAHQPMVISQQSAVVVPQLLEK